MGGDVAKKAMSSPTVWMKGMWFEWLPSLTGPVPLPTKERCLVVTALPAVVKAHCAQAKEAERWTWAGGTP